MRFWNVVRNSFFGVLSQIILIFLGFFSSRLLNHKLGQALIGANGVISNLLGILSVTELGFSTAVVYHLYRILSERDVKKTAALMNLYRTAYQIVAAVIGGLGLLFLPFIHGFMKDNPFSVSYIRILYLLWLSRTVLTYLLSYRRSILIADQKEYIVSIVTLIIDILNYSTIILIVQFTKNYLFALELNILIESSMNILLSRYIEKKYPFLKKYRKIHIDQESKHRIFADMKDIFFSKLSFKVLVSTDNLVISGIIGVVINGLYNNYCMIWSSVVNVVSAISNSLQPTVGNLFLEKDQKKNYDVFRQISFVFFWIVSFSFSSLLVLMTPFVKNFWLGEQYVLDQMPVFFMSLSAAVTLFGSPLSIVMAVSGLFKAERNLSVAATLTNILLSVTLADRIGLSGVIIGTISSNLLCIIVRTHVFFKRYLKLPVKKYILEMSSYLVLIAGEAYLTVQLVHFLDPIRNLLTFFLAGGICLLVPNGINLLLFCRSWRLKSVLNMFHIKPHA